MTRAVVVVFSAIVPAVAVADEHEANETTTDTNETTTPDAGGGDAGDGGESNETTDGSEEEEPKTTSEDPELALEQSKFASVHEIQWRDGYALVTIRTTQPVTVTHPTQGTGELGEHEAREVITTTERIERGQTTIRVELVGGSAFFTVDGATVVLSGKKTIDRSLVAYLGANQALLVGAALALAGAVVAGYRQQEKDSLDEPQNAFRRGGNQ
jgi:hypothetical protein